MQRAAQQSKHTESEREAERVESERSHNKMENSIGKHDCLIPALSAQSRLKIKLKITIN